MTFNARISRSCGRWPKFWSLRSSRVSDEYDAERTDTQAAPRRRISTPYKPCWRPQPPTVFHL